MKPYIVYLLIGLASGWIAGLGSQSLVMGIIATVTGSSAALSVLLPYVMPTAFKEAGGQPVDRLPPDVLALFAVGLAIGLPLGMRVLDLLFCGMCR